MTTLAARVLEAIEAAEGLAKAATAGPWRYDATKHHREPGACRFSEAVFAGGAGTLAVTVAVTGETDDQQSMVDAAFIAANDPDAVLRRCAADRKTVELYIKYAQREAEEDKDMVVYGLRESWVYEDVVRIRAEAYGVPLEQEET